MNFDSIHKIAAAMLYEGYILYPYRPSATKNRQRWNFGTLYPWVYAEAQRPAEPFRLAAEVLVLPEQRTRLNLKLSFLQLLPQSLRSPEDARDPEQISCGYTAVALNSCPCSLQENGTPQDSPLHSNGKFALTDPSLAWDQAVERSWELSQVSLDELLASPLVREFSFDAEAGLQGIVTLGAQAMLDGAYRVHFELENVSPLPSGAGATRGEALPRSFVSAHLLLGVTDGEFVSLLDPPESYRESAAGCANVGIFPVLAGDEPDRSMMLCSPIILYDYPRIAPESEGDFFDGTEMDEMLTLRVLTLTDAEKQEMRAGDPRGRRILERTEALTGDAMLKAHGVIRGLRDIRGDA